MWGIIQGSTTGVIKGDTGSLDYGPHRDPTTGCNRVVGLRLQKTYMGVIEGIWGHGKENGKCCIQTSCSESLCVASRKRSLSRLLLRTLN